MSITLDEPGLLNALRLAVGDELPGAFSLEGVLPHHEGGMLLSSQGLIRSMHRCVGIKKL